MKQYFILSFLIVPVSLFTANVSLNGPATTGITTIPTIGQVPPTATSNQPPRPRPVPKRRTRPVPAQSYRNMPPQTGIVESATPGRSIQTTTADIDAIVNFARKQKAIAAQIKSDSNQRIPVSTSYEQPYTASTPHTAPTIPAAEVSQPTQIQNIIPRAAVQKAKTGHHTLDVINNTNSNIVLHTINAQGEEHQHNLSADSSISSIEIPNNTESVFVGNGAVRDLVSVKNGLRAVVINNQVAGFNYIIQPLVGDYNNYILVYNESATQQLLLLDIEMPKSGIARFLPSMLGGSNSFLKITKELEPQKFCLMEIPNITSSITDSNVPAVITPSKIEFSSPSISRINVYPITPSEHNSFLITADNTMIPSVTN